MRALIAPITAPTTKRKKETTMTDTMPLADLLREYTPGDGHSWADEMKWLKTHNPIQLRLLTMSIEKTGIREPILLGDDGRVWDGHHRITVADHLGIEHVPVKHAGSDDE